MSDHAVTPEHDPNIKHMSDDIDVPMLIVAGIISIAVTVVIVFGVQAMYYYYLNKDRQVKVVDVQYREAADRLAEQRLRLNGPPAWIDQEKGVVSIPIERAMQEVVKQYQETE